MPEDEAALEGLDDFEVLGKIGEGPRTVVYRARWQGQDCALKVLKDEALPKDQDHRTRLLQVLQRLPQVEHETVVKVLSVDDRKGRFHVAMELMTQPSLADKLASGLRLTEREVVVLGRQMAQALGAAGETNLPHGDLVPSNIWPLGEGRYKVSDFAIKKFLSEEPRDGDLQAGRPGDVGSEEPTSAEALLRSRSHGGTSEHTQKDFAMLAGLMLGLLGGEAAEQGEEEGLDDYRERLRELVKPPVLLEMSTYTANALRQILTPAACRAPNDIVVELATAMVFQRRSRDLADKTEDGATEGLPAAEEKAPAAAPAGPDETAAGRAPAPLPPQAEAGEVTTFFVSDEGGEGQFFTLGEGEQITLGRDPDQSRFTVEDASASRRHCTISRQGGVILLRDEGSSNGTFVNGQRVQEIQVKAGDILRIGRSRVSVAVPFAAEE